MKHKKDYPDNHAEGRRDDPRMMEGVYAGPDFFARQQDPRMFQAVYAGPDFYAQQNTQFHGAPAPRTDAPDKWAPQVVEAKPQKYCTVCGMPIAAGAKFCTECGTPLPRDDT